MPGKERGTRSPCRRRGRPPPASPTSSTWSCLWPVWQLTGSQMGWDGAWGGRTEQDTGGGEAVRGRDSHTESRAGETVSVPRSREAVPGAAPTGCPAGGGSGPRGSQQTGWGPSSPVASRSRRHAWLTGTGVGEPLTRHVECRATPGHADGEWPSARPDPVKRAGSHAIACPCLPLAGGRASLESREESGGAMVVKTLCGRDPGAEQTHTWTLSGNQRGRRRQASLEVHETRLGRPGPKDALRDAREPGRWGSVGSA